MMHIAIVEDFVFDQKHLINLIQKNFEKYGEMADFTCYESGESFLELSAPVFQRRIYGYHACKKTAWTGLKQPKSFELLPRGSLLSLWAMSGTIPLKDTGTSAWLSLKAGGCRRSGLVPQWDPHLSFRTGLHWDSGCPWTGAVILPADSSGWFFIRGNAESPPDHHTLKGDVATRLSFSDLMALLPKGGRFYMSGRSLLLNFSQVISVEEDGSVRLKNGSCLFCSRRKKKETKEAFMEYLFTCMRKGMITDE